MRLQTEENQKVKSYTLSRCLIQLFFEKSLMILNYCFEEDFFAIVNDKKLNRC